MIRERPGLAPAALFHLIGASIFLRLSDVASGLPPYEERVLLSSMDTEEDATGFSQRSAYDSVFETLRAALTEALAKGSKRLLATYLQTLLAYPDGCTRGETVFDPESEEVLIQVPPLSRDTWIGVRFPPLVDEETWEHAQVLRKRRLNRSARNTKVFYLLQHLVRCTECDLLMGCRSTKRQTIKSRGKTYTYDLDPPRRYYKCYGMHNYRLRCREHPMIRAERLEDLVWSEVKRLLENPDLIVAGLEALDSQEDSAAAEDVARTEREFAGVQLEEDRAIRLYVSDKITEEQLDHQRKFISERLERLQAKLDEHRARESAHAEQRVAVEHVMQWTRQVGSGLNDLPDEERRELLDLLLEEATIDRDNNVSLTLAIPTDDLVPIAQPASPTTDHRPPTTLP